MAPSPHPDSTSTAIEYTPEYNAFIEKLVEYHEKRGTEFVREPRVGSRSIDLLKLYKMVMERGGYDKVSDEKLAWRKVGEDFNLGQLNLPALAFMLKTVYYKNLAAYEISTVHGKEPPPKEILEYQTAKGGSLLTRTMENYKTRKDFTNDQSEASGDDGTPARGERNGSEEAPGSGGRVTRGLRQAPPQRFDSPGSVGELWANISKDIIPTRHTTFATESTYDFQPPHLNTTKFEPAKSTASRRIYLLQSLIQYGDYVARCRKLRASTSDASYAPSSHYPR